MRPSLWLTILAGWSCFALHVVSAQAARKIYKKVGDQVVLEPGVSTTPPINKIVWRDGDNLATQWEPEDGVIYYRHFKVNTALNFSNGEMTITGLTPNYSAVYTPEINDLRGPPIELRVISRVPVPTVTKDCNEATCTLTCEGNIAGVEEVTYTWKSDDRELIPQQTVTVHKKDFEETAQFSCEISNPVSQEVSKPLPNPFKTRGMNVNMGLTVLISLLAVVIVLALVHRCKAGDWFFNKESMPFEGDFWRKEQRQRRNAAESNGIKDHQEQGFGDEETRMT